MTSIFRSESIFAPALYRKQAFLLQALRMMSVCLFKECLFWTILIRSRDANDDHFIQRFRLPVNWYNDILLEHTRGKVSKVISKYGLVGKLLSKLKKVFLKIDTDITSRFHKVRIKMVEKKLSKKHLKKDLLYETKMWCRIYFFFKVVARHNLNPSWELFYLQETSKPTTSCPKTNYQLMIMLV